MTCSQARSDSPSVSSAQKRLIGSAFCIQTNWSPPSPGSITAKYSLVSGLA